MPATVTKSPRAFTAPFLLTRATTVADDPDACWAQLAQIGSYKSKTYGEFDISEADLLMMEKNFRANEPHEVPVDYDHRSMRNGPIEDGKAAGWVRSVETRNRGTELWALIRWTPVAATAIRNLEWKYLSPSFTKDYTDKHGKGIGATLIGAGLTNYPFLIGMVGPTLLSASIADDCAFPIDSRNPAEASMKPSILNLGEIGQRVMIAPGHARTESEVSGTFEISEVDGEFAALKDAAGLVHKWFKFDELLPASSTPANPVHPPLRAGVAANEPGGDAKAKPNDGATAAPDKKPQPQKREEPVTMSASDELLSLTADYKRTHACDDRTALLALSRQRPDLATAHREVIGLAAESDASQPISLHNTRTDAVLSLAARPGETFDDLCARTVEERRITWGEAARLVARARPDMAATR